MDTTRLQGIGLFSFIPLVLLLFTRPPTWLGPTPALLAGIAIMAAHRLVAEPWARRRCRQRSLWSGARLPPEDPGLALEFQRRQLALPWRAADARERRLLRSFAAFSARHGRALRLGIFGPLLLFLLSSLQLALWGPFFPGQRAWSLALFQGGIALAVVPLVLLFRRSPPPPDDEPIAFPFPLHNLALLGVRNTLVLFATVGLWWLYLALARILEQVGF